MHRTFLERDCCQHVGVGIVTTIFGSATAMKNLRGLLRIPPATPLRPVPSVLFATRCPRSKTRETDMRSRKPRPPDHLRPPTQVWWTSVLKDYALEDHHLRLLQAACESWDRAQEAREILARDGIVVGGREGGMRPHPAVGIERDSRLAFVRTLRELDLDVEAPGPERTGPPALRSNRRSFA